MTNTFRNIIHQMKSFTKVSHTLHNLSPVPRSIKPPKTSLLPSLHLPHGKVYPPFLPPTPIIFSSSSFNSLKPAHSSVKAPNLGSFLNTPKIALNHPAAFFCSPVLIGPRCRL